MSIKTKKDKEIWARPGQGYLFSHYFKLITTARLQMMMKGIANKFAGVERWGRISMVDRIDTRLIKTIKTLNGGVVQVRG